ncbi:MAG TPA: hypothetical protein DEF45_06910, partial [Rhodopirellula sp.]|nr:hypothetical protein [Rhodopirellula sp.]
MSRPTSTNPKKRRIRSRLRERLDGLLTQKLLPVRQERQAAPQVRQLESRFVLDASAALLGLDALSSGWESQAAEVQSDVSHSTGVSSQEHMFELVGSSATGPLHSFRPLGHSVGAVRQFANTDANIDALGLELDLSVGSDLTSELYVSLATTDLKAASVAGDSNYLDFDLGEVEPRRGGCLTAEGGGTQTIGMREFESSQCRTDTEVGAGFVASLGFPHVTQGNVADVSVSASGLAIKDQGQTNSGVNEVVFLDAGVEDYETLAADFREGVEVLILEGTQDGVTQISQALEGRVDLDAIHLVSHGSAGSLQLGSAELSSDSMTQYADALSQIGSSLTDSGDLMIYGCDVAQGEIGKAFIADFAQATAADVAASTDKTGAGNLGGNWVLEYSLGETEDTLFADHSSIEAFSQLLDTDGPAVVGVTASDPVITDAVLASGSFTLTVDFSESMDQSVNPVLSFPTSSEDPTNTITFSSGAWTDADTYVAAYTLADANEAIPDIDVYVAGAVDVAGNLQVASTANDRFSVDTLKPTLVSVVRANADYTNAASVDFQITFSENVTGVDLDGSDFSLVTSIGDASILSVAGTNSVYTVTVDTGTSSGAIALGLVAEPTIQDAVGNDLADRDVSGANESYTIASTEVLLVDGNVSVTDVRDASADDLTLSVVGANLVISSDSGAIAIGPGVSRISDASVSVALDDITGSNGVTVETGGLDDTVTVLGVDRQLYIDGGSGTDEVQLQDNAISTNGGDLTLFAETITQDLNASVDAANVSLTNTGGDLKLNAAVTVVGDLALNVTGKVRQGILSSIFVAGDTYVTADVITLDDVSNDFQGVVNATAFNAEFVDATGVSLGDIDVAGDFVVEALNGSIDDGVSGAVGDDINVGGVASLSAFNAIVVDDETNDFAAVVNAAGTDLSLRDASDITLGTVVANGDLTITASSGSIVGSGRVQVSGQSDLQAAGDIGLVNALNGFLQVVNANASDIELRGNADLILGAINAVNLQVDILGSITQDASGLAVSGDVSLVASAKSHNIILNNAANVLEGAVAADGLNVELVNSLGLKLGDFDVDSLVVSTSGAGNIVQVAGTSIEVRLDAAFIAVDNDVRLDAAANEFISSVSVVADSLVLRNSLRVFLGSIDVSELSVEVLNGGGIRQSAGSVVEVAGVSQFTAVNGSVIIGSAGNYFADEVNVAGVDVVLSAADSINLGVVLAENLDVTVGGNGDITQNVELIISGQCILKAAGGSVLLAETSNDFNQVGLDAATVVLTDSTGLLFRHVVVDDLLLTTGGRVEQVAGTMVVTGTLEIHASGFDVSLDRSANDFADADSDGSVSVIGKNVVVDDQDGVAIANVVATTLKLDVGGDISQKAGSAVAVNDAVELSAAGFDVTLSELVNDFGGDVVVSGQHVTLADQNDISLLDITSDVLSVVAVGNVVDGDLGNLFVSGNADFVGSEIRLGDDVGNRARFGSLTFNSSGAVSITEDNHMEVRGASTAGEEGLELTTSGNLLVSGSVDVLGDSRLFADEVTVNAKVDTTGSLLLAASEGIEVNADLEQAAASLQSNDHITIRAAIVADDSVLVFAGQDGSGGIELTAMGSVETTAAGSVVLMVSGLESGGIELAGATTAVEQVQMISDGGSINGPGLVTSNELVLVAADGLGDETGLELSVSDVSARTSAGNIEIDNVLGTTVNVVLLIADSGSISFDQSGGGHLMTGAVSASDAIELVNANDIALTGSVFSESLKVNALGALTDGAEGDLAIAGLAEFAAGSIDLGDDSGNVTDFGSLTFHSAGAVVIGEDSSLNLVGSNTAGSVTLESVAGLSDVGATILDVAGLLDVSAASIALGAGELNAGSLMFDSAGVVGIEEDSSMVIAGASHAGSGLNLSSNEDVTLDAAVTVVGDSNIVAGVTSGGIDVNAKLTGSGAILLDAADEITVNAAIDPTTVTLRADDDITVNSLVAASELITVSAGQDGSGNFILNSSGRLSATGASSDVAVAAGTSSGNVTLHGIMTALDQVVIAASSGSVNGSGLVASDAVDLNAGSGIGNALGLELSATSISADTTVGDIEIDNDLGTGVSVTSLTTGAGSVSFDQTGGGEVAFTGPVASGEAVDGGSIELTGTAKLVVDGDVSSESGEGGTLVASGATLNGAVTVGAGHVMIQGGSLDLVVDSALNADADITLSALRDVIVSAVVDADGGGSIVVVADSNGALDPGAVVHGHGGIRITAAGQLDAQGDVIATGSDLFATVGQVDSVLIDADGVDAQVLAVGDVLLSSRNHGPDDASVVINGVVRAVGETAMVGINGQQDVVVGELGAIVSEDGSITITADNGGSSNGGAVLMADGSGVLSTSGQIVIAADGDIRLGLLSTNSTSESAVDLTTTSGSIVDGGDRDIDVVANSGGLNIRSETGIGVGNAIEMSVEKIDAENASIGSVQLVEFDDVLIENLRSLDSGDVLFESATGAITVLSSGRGVGGSDNVRVASLTKDVVVDADVVSGSG